MFFIYGVEQVPLPVGAVLFNEEGILLTLLLLFVFSVPLLVYNNQNITATAFVKNTTNKPLKPTKTDLSQEVSVVSEEWEEASLEDLESNTPWSIMLIPDESKKDY